MSESKVIHGCYVFMLLALFLSAFLDTGEPIEKPKGKYSQVPVEDIYLYINGKLIKSSNNFRNPND